jgi:hypothetical protein
VRALHERAREELAESLVTRIEVADELELSDEEIGEYDALFTKLVRQYVIDLRRRAP